MLGTAITDKEFNRNYDIMIDTISNEYSVLQLVKSDVTITTALSFILSTRKKVLKLTKTKHFSLHIHRKRKESFAK